MSLEVKESYLSKSFSIGLLEHGLVLIKGDSVLCIQNKEHLQALKRFVDKLQIGDNIG